MSAPGLDHILVMLDEAFTELNEWIGDTSTPAFLVEADEALAEVTDKLKVLTAGTKSRLQKIATEGPAFLPDGRTLRLDVGTKRKMSPRGKALIRDRIYNKARVLGEGEVETMIRIAIGLTEEVYTSPSTEPKWGGLQALGFSSWKDVADVDDEHVKGVVIDGPRSA